MSYEKLSPKQKAFVDQYTIDFNGNQAAIRAGYSAKSAKEQASVLLTNPNVAAALKEKTKEQGNNNKELKARLVKLLETIAFSKLTDYGTIGPSGFEVADFSNMDRMTQSCVREFSVTESNSGVHARIKLSSQEKAIELLCRHLGMLTDKIEHKIVKPTIIEFSDGKTISMGMEESEPIAELPQES